MLLANKLYIYLHVSSNLFYKLAPSIAAMHPISRSVCPIVAAVILKLTYQRSAPDAASAHLGPSVRRPILFELH